MKSALNGKPPHTIQAKRALLAERLRKASKKTLPLSFAQQRLWFLDQLEPNTALYNVPTVARLIGKLDLEALGKSLNAIVARHESLRTQIICVDEDAAQSIRSELTVSIEGDGPGSTATSFEEAMRIARAEVVRPFDLATDGLIRARVVKIAPEDHLLILVMHHIVSDEWSLKVFFNELSVFYQGYAKGLEPSLSTLPIQYADYAQWQRDWVKGDIFEKQLAYWKQQLSGALPNTEFPLDHARGSLPTFRGRTETREIGPGLTQKLRSIANSERVTMFMLLLAAFKALIYRYTQQDDVIVGAPIAGRTRVETEGLIGFFVNTLALRTRLTGDLPFRELLTRVRETVLGATANQDLPFEKLVEEIHPERSLSHLPFTRVMFALQNAVLEEMNLGGTKVEFHDIGTDTAKFEITFVVQETSWGLRLKVEYNCDLYESASIQRILNHFENLLAGIAEGADTPLHRLPMMSQAELRQVLLEWNKTDAEYPRDKCIHEIFELQAARTPLATAVDFDGERLTYSELNGRANQLAHHLRKLKVGPDVPVGLCVHRSAEMVVAMLAILKAGGAYVPLDSAYPKERLGFMLHDTHAPVVLTQYSLLPRIPRNGAQVFCIDTDWELVAGRGRENVRNAAKATNLAYVMYTSGSTGQPKGVCVPHRGITRLVLNSNYIRLDATERIGQVSNVSFDAATFEVWGALLNGGQLVGITGDVALSPKEFAREIRERGVTAMFLTSALFNQLVAEAPGAFQCMRTLMAGGEALDPKSVRALLADRPPQNFVNGYGPTENTTFSCCAVVREVPANAASVPIGRPISNSRAYVLDEFLNPVPIGVPGELFLAGDGLAVGYWNRPELTEKAFIRPPANIPESVLYRSRDLVRYLPDGNIEFLGRMDHQVKIRGFRIELGEIEAVLGNHPAVRECVVVACGEKSEQKRLVAYFTSQGRRAPTASALRSHLQQKLPEFMLPSAFVQLNSIPLTPNGKVDRQALPAPTQSRPELEGHYAAPRDEVEAELTKIWEQVLDVKPIGIEDRFFDLGGHSLLATKVVLQIEKRFGKKLRLATIFQAPTVEQLAAVIREEIKEGSITAGTSLVEIQSRGTKPPFFLVHGAGGGMFWGYVNLSRHLGADQPIYGFRSRGLDGKAELESIEEMAASYIRDLRVIQPKGPYYLGGYCFGGNVAFEMARQLCEQGEHVELLALMNCAPPNSNYSKIKFTPLWMARFGRNLFYWLNYFRQWTPSQRREFFNWKFSRLKKKLDGSRHKNVSAGMNEAEKAVDLSSFSAEQQKLWAAHIHAQRRYQPRPFPGRVRLFRSKGHPVWCSFDPSYGWADYALSGVDVTVVPGTHEKILKEPAVGELARELSKYLSKGVQMQDATLYEIGRSSVAERVNRDETELINYWKGKLEGAPDLLEVPTDFSRSANRIDEAAMETVTISEKLTADLNQLSASSRQPVWAVAFAAVQVLLKRHSRTNDFVTGVRLVELNAPETIPGSSGAEVRLIRSCFDEDISVTSLISKIIDAHSDAVAKGDCALEKICKALVPNPDPSFHPIVQCVFDFGSSGTLNRGLSGHANFDLEFGMVNKGQGAQLTISYAKDLFKADTITRMLRRWETLLESVAGNPENRISELRMLPAEEEHLVLREWNSTDAPYPFDRNLVDLFEEQASRTPGAEAIVDGETRLTYEQLRGHVLRIAMRLQREGIENEALVGICMERSWRTVAAILGTLKVGAAYVPMDPAYPAERIAFMIEDAKAKAIFTQRKLLKTLPVAANSCICIEDIDWTTELPAKANWPSVAPSNLAYVIYTSGSTGKPKGVALEHRNAVAFVAWANQVYDASELAGVLFSTSICFDLSIYEMFVPLSCGGKIIMVANALALPSLPAKNEVTLINTVPSAMREMVRLKAVPDSVTVVNLAGEPLPTPLVDQIYSQTSVKKVYDLYGPTETTTYSTFTLRKAGEPATIGRPMANEQVYILDESRRPVPIGVPGEMYIGGVGLAREYLNRPEMTKERFVANPFNPGSRLYRTGDLARWRADGQIDFLGRIDNQVKIRGFRVELGEIESVLKKQPGVSDAVVLAREDQSGSKRLVGYVVFGQNQTATVEQLKEGLKSRLPEYMVPSVFVFLERLPQTPNGKIDRKALPPPDVEAQADRNDIVLPTSEVEAALVEIWREVLKLKQISTQDDFFELGGHSLLATQVVSRVREKYEIDVPLSAIFDRPTIIALAKGITENVWTKVEAKEEKLRPMPRLPEMPTSFVQDRLWFLDQLNPDSDAYNVPVAIRLNGELHSDALQWALNQVIARHEALRTTFVVGEDGLKQHITPELTLSVPLIDFANSGRDSEVAASREVDKIVRQPFDLESGPLIRASLIRISTGEHILVIVCHHTISDGWSLGILLSELQVFYEARINSREALLAPLEIQYADFAHWQRSRVQNGALGQHVEYWRRELTGALSQIHFPDDPEANSELSAKAGITTLQFSRKETEAIDSVSRREGVTSFITLMSAFCMALKKWTSQEDMVVGTVLAGRDRRELENLIGCFMNFLPVRIRVNNAGTCRELLASLKKTILEGQRHQDCPFEKIVAAINPERQTDRNPLYNAAFLFQNFPVVPFKTAKLTGLLYPVSLDDAQLDLRIEAQENSEGLALSCEYRKSVFSGKSIEDFMTGFRSAVHQITTNPGVPISGDVSNSISDDLPGSTTKPTQTIVISGNFTVDPVEDALKYWLSEIKCQACVKLAPFDQVFQQLLDPGSEFSKNTKGLNVTLLRIEEWITQVEANSANRTLDEFVDASKAFAGRATAPHLICLCPPSIAAASGPGKRSQITALEQGLCSKLADTPGVFIVTPDRLQELYSVPDYYDASSDELGKVPYTPQFYTAIATIVARQFHGLNRRTRKVIALDCDNTLWSGVCGEDGAKGVHVNGPFKVLQEFMRAQQDTGMLLCLCSKNNEEDVWDVFNQRMEMPLRKEHFAAARLNWSAKSENLISLANELGVGLDSFVFVDDNPVECAEVRANCPGVLVLQIPGDSEQIPEYLNHSWVFDRFKLTTEDRRRTELYREQRDREALRAKSPTLADFIAGLQMNISIEPMGSEQLPRVAQLSQRTNQFNFTTRRYTESEIQLQLSQVEILTVSVSDRFGSHGLVGAIIVRCKQDALEVDTLLLSCRVLGRGVEHRMLAHLGAVAQQRGLHWVDVHFTGSAKNKPARDFLESVGAPYKQPLNGGFLFRFPAGYAADLVFNPQTSEQADRPSEASKPSARIESEQEIVAWPDLQQANVSEIHERVEAFTAKRIAQERRAKMTRQSGGKSDSANGSSLNAQTSPGASFTDLECKIIEIWKKLLRVENVGLNDNFFDVGGHSLMAVRLFSEIAKVTGKKLPLVTIFTAPTIAQLIPKLQEKTEKRKHSLIVPIQPAGTRPPLFLVHGAGGDVLWGYANLAGHVSPDQPIYGLKSRGQVGLEEVTSLEEMASCYIQEVRSFQKKGPYYLGGYCFGGNVAYEMARQLQAQGEEVALVLLLDSSPSNAGYEKVPWWRLTFGPKFVRNLSYWLEDFTSLQPAIRRKFVARKVRALGRKLANPFAKEKTNHVDLEEVIELDHFAAEELKLWQIHLDALVQHVQKPYDGRVVLLRTRGQPVLCSLEQDFCWGRLVKRGVEVRVVPGSHESVFVEPNVAALGREVTQCLQG